MARWASPFDDGDDDDSFTTIYHIPSGNAADDAYVTCLAAMPPMLFALARVLVIALVC